MKEMLTVRLHQITEPRGAESGPDVTSRLRLSIVPRENLLLAASIAELCEMMKAAHWCFSGGKKKRNCPYIFHRPFSPGEPTLPARLDGHEGCLLVNDNGSRRMAPWIACIIKKMSALPVCLRSWAMWRTERLDVLVMHDHELSMKWPEIQRKRRKNIWTKHSVK